MFWFLESRKLLVCAMEDCFFVFFIVHNIPQTYLQDDHKIHCGNDKFIYKLFQVFIKDKS